MTEKCNLDCFNCKYADCIADFVEPINLQPYLGINDSYYHYYYLEHKEAIKKRSKEYYLEHKEAIKERSKAYYRDHKVRRLKYQKDRYLANKDKLQEYQREYYWRCKDSKPTDSGTFRP